MSSDVTSMMLELFSPSHVGAAPFADIAHECSAVFRFQTQLVDDAARELLPLFGRIARHGALTLHAYFDFHPEDRNHLQIQNISTEEELDH